MQDGVPENNEGPKYGYDGYDVTQIATRHGGDFVGIMNRLDYIKSLGYTSEFHPLQ
jgi:glycosidase